MSPGASEPTAGWSVHRWQGSAAEFHALDLPFDRALWLCEPVGPALVLGSTQPDDTVDTAAARSLGVEVARRRSGGGVVFVDPSASTWIDLTIPRDDPLWVDDVSRSMLWLGEAFVVALGEGARARVHSGPFREGPHGRTVCFAGISPGEVLGPGDRKLVGISQRRGREGARFQCLVHREWRPDVWSGVLRDTEAARAVREMAVGCVPATPDELLGALVATLSSVTGGAVGIGPFASGRSEGADGDFPGEIGGSGRP